MLILLVALLAPVLDATLATEHRTLPSNFARSRRAVGVQQFYHNPNARSIQVGNSRTAAPYKNDQISSQESSVSGQKHGGSSIYDEVFKQPLPYGNLAARQNEAQSAPNSDKLFTMTASYKVASDKIKPPKQVTAHPLNQNAAIAGVHDAVPLLNLQVPVYKTSYPAPAPKLLASQVYTPFVQNSPYVNAASEKGASLPILQLQNNQAQPPYMHNFQNQPLLFNPTDYRFTFAAKNPKVNNMQSSAPFLSPLSSFQGQVIPISTVVNNQQFPQYKGATVEVYPTLGGFSTAAYQPLQTQPQLHFQQDLVHRAQPVGNLRQHTPAQGIISDVEFIDKNPTPPPPKKDHGEGDENDEHDEGYKPREGNSKDDEEFEERPDKYFKAPQTEGNFKPSSFPFKEYDEKFSKYSNRDDSSDEDDDGEKTNKYQSEDTSSKAYYARNEDEDDDDDGRRSYEKQKTEESSDSPYGPKYFDDEEFEASYRREFPREKFVYGKESSKSDNQKSEDPSTQENQKSFDYRKDNEGHGSDNLATVISKMTNDGAFGYRIAKRNDEY